MSLADHSIDPTTLRAAFGGFASGVCVIGVETADGEQFGATVNSFTSVSLAPPLLLVCLGHYMRSHDAMVQARGFGISVLAENQQSLSVRFASRGGPKWEGLEPERGGCGGLLVPGALTHFDCATERTLSIGDHTLLIGRVLACHTNKNERPLLYFRGRYDAITGSV